MKNKKLDFTTERNHTKYWLFLSSEYDLIKQKKHPKYKTVQELYRSHNIPHQTFYKYYNRYKNSKKIDDFLPQKRGPKWASRRPELHIEEKVLTERRKGLNKYEIYKVLLPQLGDRTPSPSGIYNILVRNNMNRLKHPQKEEKRKIIKTKAGELGHVDCHYLAKDLIVGTNQRSYLLCVIDSYTRLAWTELIYDIKSLTTMFATLKSINFLNVQYGIKFEEMLSDNGSEFSSRSKKSRYDHPFERMLLEMGIKHRYIRPYRPQTNGKVERFWRTLNEDLIEGTTFESFEAFKEELQKYLFYYNEHRPHQALNGLTPKEFLEQNMQRIS